MLPIDSLLQLAHREGATEVRVGTDRAPVMLGSKRKLSVPSTSDETLRHLLGPLLSKDVEARVRAGATVELAHEVPTIGPTKVTLLARTDGFGIDVRFLFGAKPSTQPPNDGVQADEPASPAADTRAAPSPTLAALAPSPPRDPAAPPSPSTSRASAAPAAELLDLLLRAHALGASDLHLAPGDPPVVRVHGTLDALEHGPIDTESLVAGLFDDAQRQQLAGGSSVDFVLELPPESARGGREPRVRGNAYRASSGLALALRLLPREAPTLESLGAAAALRELAHLPNGLVVITGPSGAGKSTTLAALAREALRKRSIVLLSLEDPIEHLLPSVAGRSVARQRQIGRDVRDFATGLRDALREDPDVIVVGEMRDAESVALALTAAETGHLVLATLHSRSAASAIERIADTQPEGRQAHLRAQLAESLRFVVAQRLVPRVAGGRTLALELLKVTTSVASGLREGKAGTVTSAMQSGRQQGMFTLERSLADLVRVGEITLESARAHANDREMLAKYLELAEPR